MAVSICRQLMQCGIFRSSSLTFLRAQGQGSSALLASCRSALPSSAVLTQVQWYSAKDQEFPTSPKDNAAIDEEIARNLVKLKEKNFATITDPEDLKHFRKEKGSDRNHVEMEPIFPKPPVGTSALPHPIWSEEELYSVKVTHKKPKGIVENLSYISVKLLRTGFDIISGFNRGERTEKVWLSRIAFLETVAGVPGMVAAMVRHLHSLRRMRRDHGWIHTLLEEAENERMHLMTVLYLKKPGPFFRAGVVVTQGIFVTYFSLAYMLSPRYCHRLVAYLEEEAVITYSKLLKDMDGGSMKHWNDLAAPPEAISYWQLSENAKMYDVVLAIRADEAHHRIVNHTLGSMKPEDYNPYKPGQ